MKAVECLAAQISQAEFAELIGVSEAKVSQLFSEGVLEKGECGHAWLTTYCARLREVAAGRGSMDAGGLDLVQERAALAREQRIGQALKNHRERQTFLPVTLLAEVLAKASQAVVERFEHLPGAIKKACPDLPEAARLQLFKVIDSARNEWVRQTAELVVNVLSDEDEPDPLAEDIS